MRTNTYADADLQRRSDLATSLKYGAEAPAAPTVRGTYAENIPFPAGLAPTPKPITPAPKPDAALPQADVITMMDTTAESAAMADVLTPGYRPTAWYPYTKNFAAKFLPQIAPHAPARQSQRLGSYFMTQIGTKKVLVYKTELHMHEDAKKLSDGSYTLPIRDMFKQMIGDAKPQVFLTTGTAGGVYCSMHLGDVMVSRAAQFYCQKDFAAAPFNHQKFQSNWPVPDKYVSAAENLMRGFASHLTGQSQPRGTPPSPDCACSGPGYPTNIYYDGTNDIPAFHPILTTDFFEFGTSTNNLEKLGMAVEMDDACLGLACSEMTSPPRWACVRNASDPCINGTLGAAQQESCAEYYYTKFGYWTTVMSALATWAIIAGLSGTNTGRSKAKQRARSRR
jgi:nucleoside phosphorylase